MSRLWVILVALLLAIAAAPVPAVAGDDDRAGASSGSDEDRDDDDDEDDDDEDDDDEDEEDDDEDEEDEEDDDEDDDDEDDDGDRRGRTRNRGDEADATPARVSGATQPRNAPAAAAATVTVQDRSFTPATIRVAVGGTVTWENVSREHTVTAQDDSFDSGVFDAGETFSKQFTAAATVSYLCMIHPEMTGEVIVGGVQSGNAAPPAGGGSSAQPSLGNVAEPQAAAAAESAEVEVRDFEFSPQDVTIAPGGTVRWTLTGKAPHTVTSDGFDSGTLASGDTYEQTFTELGTVDYRCEFHPDMTGTVTVAETAAPAGDVTGGSGGNKRGAPPGETAGESVALANSGFGGVPALLAALVIILLGWGALVSGRRFGGRRRRQA